MCHTPASTHMPVIRPYSPEAQCGHESTSQQVAVYMMMDKSGVHSSSALLTSRQTAVHIMPLALAHAAYAQQAAPTYAV